MAESRKWLGVKEVADIIGRSRYWIYRHRAMGDAPIAYCIGNCLRFKPEDVESWVQSRRDL